MVTNLHISMTPFLNESRVLKETRSIVASGIADKVCIAALHEDGLEPTLTLDAARDVVRIQLRSRKWGGNVLVQLLKYVEFSWKVARLARRRKATIFNIHSVALLPLGMLLKLLTGGKLVYDAHELETEVNGRAGLRKKASKLLEQSTIRFVDLLIVVSPGIETWYRKRYGMEAVVTVLNAPHYKDVQRTDRLRQALAIPAEKRIMLYQGALTAGRGVAELIEAAPQLADTGYVIVFMGYGELQPAIEAAAKNSDTIYFHPAVPPDQLMGYTASGDVGIASIEDTCLSYHLCLPNKLFEYVMAGLPSIVSNLPEMERFVTSNKVGVCVDAWDSASLRAALKKVDALRGPDLDARLAGQARQTCWEGQEPIMVQAYKRYVLGDAAVIEAVR